MDSPIDLFCMYLKRRENAKSYFPLLIKDGVRGRLANSDSRFRISNLRSSMALYNLKSKIDRLGVFLYSDEEGTDGFHQNPKVTREVMLNRKKELMTLQSGISRKRNRALIGKKMKALVDGSDSRSVLARLYHQAPEVDGVLRIDHYRSSQLRKHNRCGPAQPCTSPGNQNNLILKYSFRKNNRLLEVAIHIVVMEYVSRKISLKV